MPDPIGRLSAVMLNVEDMEKACAFYQVTVGLPLKFRDGNRWAAFDAGGITLALAGQAERGPSPIALNFKVENVSTAVERLVDAGATVVSGPANGAHEIRAALRDVNGHVINIFSPKSK